MCSIIIDCLSHLAAKLQLYIQGNLFIIQAYLLISYAFCKLYYRISFLFPYLYIFQWLAKEQKSASTCHTQHLHRHRTDIFFISFVNVLYHFLLLDSKLQLILSMPHVLSPTNGKFWLVWALMCHKWKSSFIPSILTRFYAALASLAIDCYVYSSNLVWTMQ